MNCKPGDLAVIVSSRIPENVGRFVTALNFAGNLEPGDIVSQWGRTFQTDRFGPHWFVEASSPVRSYSGCPVKSGLAADSQLRPIRDQDGEDEMIRIAGKPIDTRTPV